MEQLQLKRNTISIGLCSDLNNHCSHCCKNWSAEKYTNSYNDQRYAIHNENNCLLRFRLSKNNKKKIMEIKQFFFYTFHFVTMLALCLLCYKSRTLSPLSPNSFISESIHCNHLSRCLWQPGQASRQKDLSCLPLLSNKGEKSFFFK